MARRAERAPVTVGLLGSRPLGTQVLRYLARRRDVRLVGVVAPPFRGWWREDLAATARRLRVPVVSAAALFAARPALVVSVNYWRRLPLRWVRQVPLGVVNLHHSYRLRLRGRYSTTFAILRARADRYWRHGTTLHYVTGTLDGGPIIATRACPIRAEDTAATLFARVEVLASRMFRDAFPALLRGRVRTRPPSPRWWAYRRGSIKDKAVDPAWPPERIYDFVRAWTFPGRPRPYLRCGDRKVYLTLSDGHDDNGH